MKYNSVYNSFFLLKKEENKESWRINKAGHESSQKKA